MTRKILIGIGISLAILFVTYKAWLPYALLTQYLLAYPVPQHRLTLDEATLVTNSFMGTPTSCGVIKLVAPGHMKPDPRNSSSTVILMSPNDNSRLVLPCAESPSYKAWLAEDDTYATSILHKRFATNYDIHRAIITTHRDTISFFSTREQILVDLSLLRLNEYMHRIYSTVFEFENENGVRGFVFDFRTESGVKGVTVEFFSPYDKQYSLMIYDMAPEEVDRIISSLSVN